MANPPEFWTFAAANLLTFGLGSVLTALSFYAYMTTRRRSLRNATVGFATLTLGMVVEPAYQLGFRSGYDLGGRELLALQTIEGTLLGVGLGLLFYSVYRRSHGAGETRARVDDRVQRTHDDL